MSRDWREFLADVAARHDLADIDADQVLRLALERALEITGEAAGRIPSEVQARYPEIPWRAMIGARHRLAHG
jgi:uncharacterized protein with HEPN domain